MQAPPPSGGGVRGGRGRGRGGRGVGHVGGVGAHRTAEEVRRRQRERLTEYEEMLAADTSNSFALLQVGFLSFQLGKNVEAVESLVRGA